MDVMTLAAKLTLNTSEFNSSLDTSEKKMKGMTTGGIAWGNVISNAITAAARAVSNTGKQVVQTGMEFDAMMSQVKALGQLEEDNFIKVRKKAMELGESTKFTAAQVGEAFSYMALAGWDTEEMLAGIEGVLNLAAASGEDLGRTSDIVTDALTALGLTAADTDHFVNVLATASANSNTTVGMMGEAFKFLATTGGVLGYTIDDVATALGLLANNGIKASQAGTSMRQIINTLINPSKDAAEAMDALGLSLFEAGTDKRKPLLQVIQELREIFKGAEFDLEGFDEGEMQAKLDELNAWYDEAYEDIFDPKISKKKSQRERELKELQEEYNEKFEELLHPNETFLGRLGNIGGLRGISSLFALMMTTDEDLAQLTGAIEEADEGTGAAAKMADEMLNNLMGDITIMKSALEGLQIIVSDSFKEQLRSFVQDFTEQIGKMNDAFQQNGVLGMFVSLADWVINGITGALMDSSVTGDQARSFGQALGDFVGRTVSNLVSNAPELISGLFSAGANLAAGIVGGLFAGLFGDESEVDKYKDHLADELVDIEVSSTKATAITNYLQSLIDQYGEEAKKTNEWKAATEELEKVMPGVKTQLEEQGKTLQENLDKVIAMKDEMRTLAIQEAMRETLEKEYKLLGEQNVELAKAEAVKGAAELARSGQTEQVQNMMSKYLEEAFRLSEFANDQELFKGALSEYQDWGNWSAEEQILRLSQLAGMLSPLYKRAGETAIWDQDMADELLNEEQITAIADTLAKYDEVVATQSEEIKRINEEIAATEADIAITEAAVQRTSESLGITASGVSTSGNSLVNAIYGVASSVASAGGIGDRGSRPLALKAKGDWNIPYDGYIASLHRGEMVLTASQARKYREGSGMDMAVLMETMKEAIRDGMKDVSVNSYLSGRNITEDVNRNMVRELKARRFAT